MRLNTCLLSSFALVAVTACTPTPDVSSSRSDTPVMSFAAQSEPRDAQGEALAELSRRIVVQTTLKGAGIGAAVGCGMAVVSAGNASNCLAGAATGALGGAVIGRVTGQHTVARQIERVDPSAVVRTLRKTNAQMALVQRSLPARIAAQQEALARLDLQRASGRINNQQHADARASIQAERSAIAAALIETENNASRAAANLRVARGEGQSGLDWHISAAEQLARNAVSARSDISLL